MRKIRKRIFAAALAAALLLTAPGSESYAAGNISESVTGLEDAGGIADGSKETERPADDTKKPETGTGDTEEPGTSAGELAQEPSTGTLEEDTVKCICETLCTEDSINEGCPVCSAEGTDLSGCTGKETENSSEEDTENADTTKETENEKPEDTDTNLCTHHKEHTVECGYSEEDNTPCGYVCRICPIEDLITALTEQVTEDNAADARAQLDSKTFTVAQSGTPFEGDVEAYNGSEKTNSFTASDTITVKATPIATGAVPQTTAARLRGEPGAGQMSLYVEDTLVSSQAVSADADGTYTMTVSASDVLTLSGVEPNGDPITLTVKFVENDNMAGAEGTVEVTISAVAKVENGSSTTYVGVLGDAFIDGNSGATVTLLTEADIDTTFIPVIGDNTFTLDLNGQTVRATYRGAFRISGGSMTIQDSGTGGKIESSNNTIEVTGGTLFIKSGTVSGFYGVQITGGTVNISGGAISGQEIGLFLYGGGSISLSSGTFIGRSAIQVNNNASVTLKDLLAAGCAYHQNDVPVTKAEGWVDNNNIGEVPLDAKPAWLTGTVTVKECNHTGGLTPSGNGYQHGGTCLCCGTDLPLEGHTLGTDGKCTVCGAELVAKMNDTCYTDFRSAWSAAQRAGTATVTLLADVTLPDDSYVTVANQQNFTLNSPDGEKFALRGRDGRYGVISVMSSGSLTVENVTVENTNTQYRDNSAIYVWNSDGSPQITIGKDATVTGRKGINQVGSTMTLTVSGTVEGTLAAGVGIFFNSGTLTVEEGANISGGSGGSGINQQGGSLTVNGGTISGGNGVEISNAASAKLNGGTFTATSEDGDAISVTGYPPQPLGDLLNTGWAIFKADGTAVERTKTSTGSGTFTVKECRHTGVEPEDQGSGKHGLTCPYCGDSYSHDTTLKAETDQATNTVTLSEGCDICAYDYPLGRAEFTFPKVTYGQSGTVKCAWDGPAGYYVLIETNGNQNQLDKNADEDIAERLLTLAQLFGSTKVTAGGHEIKVSFFSDAGVRSNECGLDFTVAPAPLTTGMVTLDETEVTYNGAEQKPTVTVSGLTESTDYTVSFERDDFTNAGTVNINVTGMGNYTGTVTKTFIIGKAEPTTAWSDTSQELTYTGNPAVISSPTVTLVNNENFGGTIGYSYRKQGETAYKDGLPTDAGTYTIRAHVDAAGNYAAADSANELTLTIKKADAEIAVGTAAYNVTYGDSAFTISGVTDTNSEAAVQYAVTEGTDVISVSEGAVTIRNAGTATITVSLPETANYNAAENKTITVTVAKNGEFTVSEIDKSHFYDRENTADINLAVLLPEDCGTITYGEPVTSGDVTFTAAAVESGVLSYALAKGNVNDTGTITVTVTTRNFADITITVKVKMTDQLPVGLKEGTEVTLADNTLTYGESLSRLVFNDAVFVDGGGNTVEGVLAWKDAVARPDVGTTSAVWVFTPADKMYLGMEGMVSITVNKAVPTVPAAPTVADRVYNPQTALKDIDLSGGTVTGVDGKELKGGWSWQSADMVPDVENSGYAAVFTPEDTTNYEIVTRTITVNVAKAVPYIAELPVAAGITYGETLKDSLLSGGTVLYGDGKGQAGDGAGNTGTAAGSTAAVAGTVAGSTNPVAGTFTWKEPTTKPVVADSNVTEYTVVFTPSDMVNYDSAEAKVKLTVNKAQNAPNMPGSSMSVPNSIKKAGDVPLPEGWEWQESDKDTALEAGAAVNAVAVYTGADKGNYEKETVTVAITRVACDHVAGDVLYTGPGEMAPACRSDGLGHRECTKCGSVVESGIVVKALGHTGGTATCSKRAVCTRCGQPYGDMDGSRHGSIQVRGTVAATCTTDGYTGDVYCIDCGAKTETGNATSALGHNYESSVTKEPTVAEEGVRTYTCTRCGDSYTEGIPKLPDTDVPFIKGEDGKEGWDVIRAEEEAVEEGRTIPVDMNGAAVVPADIFDRLKGRHVTMTFDMGNDILWSVDGMSVTRDASPDAPGIDFSVKTGGNTIPVTVVDNVAGGRYHLQVSLAHEGEFGFTAVLSINLGRGNAGLVARLYYYNKSAGRLEFVCADTIGKDGRAAFAFTHASDYVVVVGKKASDPNPPSTAQPAVPGTGGGNVSSGTPVAAASEPDKSHSGIAVSPKTGQTGHAPMAGALAALMGISMLVAAGKKKRDNIE